MPVWSSASGLRSISAGQNGGCELGIDSTIRCWGNNKQGQLGDGTTTDSLIPVGVKNLPFPIQAIAVGGLSCVLTSSGGVRCWGGNTEGQLGNNSKLDSSVPVPVDEH